MDSGSGYEIIDLYGWHTDGLVKLWSGSQDNFQVSSIQVFVGLFSFLFLLLTDFIVVFSRGSLNSSRVVQYASR